LVSNYLNFVSKPIRLFRKQACAATSGCATLYIHQISAKGSKGLIKPDALHRHCNDSHMPIRIRPIATLLATVLAAGALSGCGSINEKLGAGMGDVIPHWAGGLPADAPPRPGTVEYDEFMQEREKKRQEPASAKTGVSQPSSPDAVH
jgi:uncharacterized protein YceK